jgi:hypothetical protein
MSKINYAVEIWSWQRSGSCKPKMCFLRRSDLLKKVIRTTIAHRNDSTSILTLRIDEIAIDGKRSAIKRIQRCTSDNEWVNKQCLRLTKELGTRASFRKVDLGLKGKGTLFKSWWTCGLS